MIKTVWCVTFGVSDLKRAMEFYGGTLGLEKKYEFSSYVGFECGGVEIGLVPKSKNIGAEGAMSPSVEFLVDDADSFCERLERRGVRFTKRLHEEAWGGRQATFADPDGNVLEVVQMDWEKYFSVSAEGAKKKV